MKKKYELVMDLAELNTLKEARRILLTFADSDGFDPNASETECTLLGAEIYPQCLIEEARTS